MAFVLQFAPQDFVKIPKHGTIQYHPSLLPKYRGPSSINWPIIRGETKTGLTIFRPTDGLDEGPVVLQKETPIGPDDTLGTVYFDRLFPMGVQAMLEAADLVVAGKHKEIVQDESQATYEGWCRAAEAKINWANHVDFVYNLIRGCNPAPGAWTTLNGKKLQIFDARKHLVRTFGAVKGKIGEVTEVTATSVFVTAQGGRIEVLKAKAEDGKKVAARGGHGPGHHGRRAARHLSQSREDHRKPPEGGFPILVATRQVTARSPPAPARRAGDEIPAKNLTDFIPDCKNGDYAAVSTAT